MKILRDSLIKKPVSGNDPCNETIGLGRCPSTGECFELHRKCDGMFDCSDGYDEMACKFTNL